MIDQHNQLLSSFKADQTRQYAYNRKPLYCNLDERVTEVTGYAFWDFADGELSAPDAIPSGGLSRSLSGGLLWFVIDREPRVACAEFDLVIDDLLMQILAEENAIKTNSAAIMSG